MIETIALVLTGLSITASIIYYANTLRISNKARQAQVYLQIWDKFSDPEIAARSYEIVYGETGEIQLDDYIEEDGRLKTSYLKEMVRFGTVANVYEGIGVLLKNGFMDVNPIIDLYGAGIL